MHQFICLGTESGKVFLFATQNGKAIESWQAHCSSGVKSVKINAKQTLGEITSLFVISCLCIVTGLAEGLKTRYGDFFYKLKCGKSFKIRYGGS